MFFGGNAGKPVSWFVAIDGEEFTPVHGTSAYVRQCPVGSLVDVEVFMTGPNLMNP
jgi:hypothetical protein